MKTAISLPDNVYQAAEKLVDRLGTTRSHLYAEALADYIDRYSREGITQALDAVYTRGTEFDAELQDMQARSLEAEEW